MSDADVLQFGTQFRPRSGFSRAKSQPELAQRALEQQSEPVDAKELCKRLELYKKELEAEKKRRRKTAGHQPSNSDKPQVRPRSFDPSALLAKSLDFHRRDESKSTKVHHLPKTAVQRLARNTVIQDSVSAEDARPRSAGRTLETLTGSRQAAQRGSSPPKGEKKHARRKSAINPLNLIRNIEDHYGSRKSHSKSTNDLSKLVVQDAPISPTIAAFIGQSEKSEDSKPQSPLPPKTAAPVLQSSPNSQVRVATADTLATATPHTGFFTPPSRASFAYDSKSLASKPDISPLEPTPPHLSGESTPRQEEAILAHPQRIVTRPGARASVTVIKAQPTPPRSPGLSDVSGATSFTASTSPAGVPTTVTATTIIKPVPADLPKLSTNPANESKTKFSATIKPVSDPPEPPPSRTTFTTRSPNRTDTKDFALQSPPDRRPRPNSVAYVPQSAASSHARTTKPLPSGDASARISRMSQNAMDLQKINYATNDQETRQAVEDWNRNLAARGRDHRQRILADARRHSRSKEQLQDKGATSKDPPKRSSMRRAKSMPSVEERIDEFYDQSDAASSVPSIPGVAVRSRANTRSSRANAGLNDDRNSVISSPVDVISSVVANFSGARLRDTSDPSAPYLVNVASAVEAVRAASQTPAQDDERPVSSGNGENVLRWKERAMRERAIQASQASRTRRNTVVRSHSQTRDSDPSEAELQLQRRQTEKPREQKKEQPKRSKSEKPKKSKKEDKNTEIKAPRKDTELYQNKNASSLSLRSLSRRKSKDALKEKNDSVASSHKRKSSGSSRHSRSSLSLKAKLSSKSQEQLPEMPERNFSMTPESWALLEQHRKELKRKTVDEKEMRRMVAQGKKGDSEMDLPSHAVTFPLTMHQSRSTPQLDMIPGHSRSTTPLDLLRGENPDLMIEEPKSRIVDMGSHRSSLGVGKADLMLGRKSPVAQRESVATTGMASRTDMESPWSMDVVKMEGPPYFAEQPEEKKSRRRFFCF